MGSGNIARFTFDPVAERNAFISGRADRLLDRAHGVGRPRGQLELAAGKCRVAWLWRFIFLVGQRLRDRRRGCDLVFRDDGSRVGERRRIGNGRPRADRGRIIARYVRDRDRQKLCRMSMPRQASAFDAREMFAHGVDFTDGRAGAQKRTGHAFVCPQTIFLRPARSSSPRRRPTSAPGRDRPRPRRRPKQVRDRRPRGPQHPVSDVRPRSSEPCEDGAHSHAVRRRPRSGAPTQFASGRGSALRPSRPSSQRPCPRRALSTGLKAKRGEEVEGTLPDVPPIPRCETALREKSAGYRSNFPSLPTAEKTCLYWPLDRPAAASRLGRALKRQGIDSGQ